MSRPIVTAILLNDLLRAGEDIRLHKNSLITPAARDWIKEHDVPITWLEDNNPGHGNLAVVMDDSLAEMRAMRTMLDRKGGLAEVIKPGSEVSSLVSATRKLCGMISRKEVCRGVVFAQDGAAPVCVANKHKNIRAALGMNVPMVEDAVRKLGVNLLVIEYPDMTTYQMKQMIERMQKGASAPQPEIRAALEQIEQGG
jgi:ribose 5-phosphate isomerase RpiB